MATNTRATLSYFISLKSTNSINSSIDQSRWVARHSRRHYWRALNFHYGFGSTVNEAPAIFRDINGFFESLVLTESVSGIIFSITCFQTRPSAPTYIIEKPSMTLQQWRTMSWFPEFLEVNIKRIPLSESRDMQLTCSAWFHFFGVMMEANL